MMAAEKKKTPELDVGEICAAFRQAKDKREQINILGDLNLCAPRTIAGVLYRAGALEGTGLTVNSFSARYNPVAGARPEPKPFDAVLARKLFDEGKEDVAIADRLGVPIYRVQIWRRENNLRRAYSWRKDCTLQFEPKEDKPVEKALESYRVPMPQQVDAARDDADAVLTVEKLLTLLGKLLAPVITAEVSLNGEPVRGVFGYEVKVQNDRVFVDVRTREA